MKQRFLTLLTMLLMCSVALVKAETVEIGVESSADDGYIPAFAYYNYGLSEQIYLAEEIGDAGMITSISYNYVGTVTNTRQITIYMQNIDKSEFESSSDFVQVAAEDAVYEGSVSYNGAGWYTMTFETPFEYTGGNLLVVYHDHTGGYISGLNFQVYTAEKMGTLYAYSDSYNPNPTTSLTSYSGSKGRVERRNSIRLEKEAAAPVTCPRPEIPVISDITTESAVATWTAVEGVSAYEIALVEAGEEFTWEDQGMLWEEEELSLPLEWLIPNTAYDFYVRSYCSEDDQSTARKVTFRTACGVYGLPWSENFDELPTGDFAQPCWTNEHISGAGSKLFAISTVSGHDSKALQLQDQTSGTITRMTTPTFDVPEADAYELKIDVYRNASGTSYVNEGVRLLAVAEDGVEHELGFLYRNCGQTDGKSVTAETETGWYSYNFTIPVAGLVQIVLQGESYYGNDTYMDNMSIRALPTCFPPSNLHAAEATLNSVSFAWTPYNENNLNAHVVVKAGEEIVADALVNDTVYTIEGLEHSHIYNYSVTINTVCDEEESTDAYTANITLATICAPISEIPWAENFETTANNTLPVCWTTAETASYPYISSSTYSAPEGEKYLYFYGGSTYYGDEYVAMPELGAEIDINTLELSFLFKQSSVGTSYSQLVVGVMSDPTDLETFIAVQTLEQTNEITEIEVDFVNVPATHKYIAFKLPVASSATTFYVDDVKLAPQPTCIKPTNIALGEVTDNAATITWEGAAEQYELIVLYADLDVADEDYEEVTEMYLINGNSYTLENLLPVRNYGVVAGIRAICAEGDTSKMAISSTFVFRTAIPASYTEVLSAEHDELAVDFANAEEAAKWIILYGSGDNNFAIGDGAREQMGNTALYISNNGSDYAYTNNSSSASAASRLIEIPAADSVRISFDWLARGEANYDYGRVAIMPADMDENALFASPIPSEVIVLIDKMQSKTEVQHFSAVFEEVPAGRYKLVFGWKNDSSGGSNPPLAVANVNVKLYAESELSCKKVSDIHVAEVGSDYALIAWTPGKDEAAWVVTLYMADENGELVELGEIETEEPALRIEDMETATSYQFAVVVKASCGDDRYSKPVEAEISFTTDVDANAITVINEENPIYAADFNTNWFIMNSTGANHFVIGDKAEDALLNGAETALYVSNDENGTYAYTNNSFSVAAAYHRIDLEVAADTLVIDFDWLANGEGGWDYGRAFLTPAAMDIQMLGDNPFLYIGGTIVSPGSAYNVCPAGAIDLGNGKLNLATSVQHKSVTLTNVPAGAYKLIFAWGNDGSTGNNKPLSICNVNVEMHQQPFYTLTYVVDGQIVETAQYHAGDAIVAYEVVPMKEGYTFAQWDAVPATMPEGDVTVNAVFTVNSYDLVFKATWGEGHEIVVSDTQVEFGAAIVAPEAPAVEGYTFTAWAEMPETMPAHDVYVYGTYTINSYTLTVVVNGVSIAEQTLPYGTPLAPIAAAFAAQVPEGFEIVSISEYPETMPANDLTVTVTSAPIVYALTYVVDGETVATDSIAYGSTIVAREEPVKEGHTFSGWSEIPETMPNNDVTVTGTFTINQYTVTVVAENGTVEGAGVYDWGTEITLTATAAEGYEFKGWSDENTDNPRTITVTEDVTLTAVFEALPPVEEGVESTMVGSLQVINRTIIATEAIRIYTVAGQEVTAMNGNLVNGIYVVVGETINAKIRIQ